MLKIELEKTGRDGIPIMTFHGFGIGKGFFKPLEKLLTGHLFIHVRLFFDQDDAQCSTHEQAHEFVPKQSFFDKIIQCVDEQEQKVAILAFSIGARLALALIKERPEKIDKVILIAPDGLVQHPLFWVATSTGIGRFVFRQLTLSTSLLPWLLQKSEVLFPQSLQLKWAIKMIDTRDKRSLLYWTWYCLRNYKMSVAHFKSLPKELREQFYIVTGTKDSVISTGSLEQFCKELPTRHFISLDATHHQLPYRFFAQEYFGEILTRKKDGF